MRRRRLLRKLQRLRAAKRQQASALVGLWDECIADERVPELGGAALLYWTRHGGDRTVAKSSWLPRGASPRSPLEALAYGVLRAHTPDETPVDAGRVMQSRPVAIWLETSQPVNAEPGGNSFGQIVFRLLA